MALIRRILPIYLICLMSYAYLAIYLHHHVPQNYFNKGSSLSLDTSYWCKNLHAPLRGNLSVRSLPRNTANVAHTIYLENQHISPGGYFSPRDCNASETPRDSVAIIVPYRNRSDHLLTFLQHMHPLLTRQRLEYRIYVITQEGEDPFNRGKLINIGYKEAMKDKHWPCIVMHDVDHIALNDHNLYNCWTQPRRMIIASSEYNFSYLAPYINCIGGVAAISSNQFEAINGFSNNYYGWGAEDDDLAQRIRLNGMHVLMYNPQIGMKVGRYTTLAHQKANPANDRLEKLIFVGKTMKTNGLNSLRYNLTSRTEEPLFTNITANLLYNEYVQKDLPE